MQYKFISACKSWTVIEEILRVLKYKISGHKIKILLDELKAMSKTTVGKPLYSPETMTRAFQYFTPSRSLYPRLLEDYQLSSFNTPM